MATVLFQAGPCMGGCMGGVCYDAWCMATWVGEVGLGGLCCSVGDFRFPRGGQISYLPYI